MFHSFLGLICTIIVPFLFCLLVWCPPLPFSLLLSSSLAPSSSSLAVCCSLLSLLLPFSGLAPLRSSSPFPSRRSFASSVNPAPRKPSRSQQIRAGQPGRPRRRDRPVNPPAPSGHGRLRRVPPFGRPPAPPPAPPAPTPWPRC